MYSLRTILYSTRLRQYLYQILLISVIVLLGGYLYHNLQNNLSTRGIASGYSFLQNTAGFEIIMHLIPYNEQSSYFDAFVVGVLNTLLVSSLGIILATGLGMILGIARLSKNWIWAKLALVYVETIRNIPLLLQIFFWYFVVLRAAPLPRQALSLGESVFLTNRGIYLPKPLLNESFFWGFGICVLIWLILKVSAQWIQNRWGSNALNQTIAYLKHSAFWALGLLFVISFGLASWDRPVLEGFNFTQGMVIIPEFLALLLALTLYTAAFIAEIFRAGILAISKGQWEAAFSLGLSKTQLLRLIILPQALRIILPPLTNQYLNLTKNSSLAAAIAYPDLVAVFAGTVLNQTGQAVEIIGITMAVYLSISLTISGFMLLYERKTQWSRTS